MIGVRLEKGEKVIAGVRRHWFAFFLQVIALAVAALVPLPLFFVAAALHLLAAPKVWLLLFFFAVLLWLLLWILFFVAWTNYYLDMWIITDRRIVDIEQKSLFHREASECFIERIQDIKVEMHGILAAILGFGDISIQTAGTAREFLLRQVSRPGDVKELIMRLYQQSRDKGRGTAR